MDKRFICLVSCKPYDNIEKVIEGIHELKNHCAHECQIDALVALTDVRQLSNEAKKNFPEIRFGTFSIGNNGSSKFSQTVENQIFKDVDAEFVVVGETEKGNFNRDSLSGLGEKVKSSAKSGLPVMLHVFSSESGSGEELQVQLDGSLQDLSESERDRVSIVFHVDSSPPRFMNAHDLQPSLENCRVILRSIGGEEFAKRVKILLSIPKYAPGWLNSCLLGQFDGVCVNPNVLPRAHLPAAAAEGNSFQHKVRTEEIDSEMKEEKTHTTEPEVEEGPIEDLFYKGYRKSVCLVYCHVFDDLEGVVNRARELAAKVQDSIEMECLFALPFGSIAQKPNLEGLNWGIWGHSTVQTGSFGDRVLLDLCKDKGASFIVTGDRLKREVLNQSSQAVSQQIAESLKEGVLPIVGVTSTLDLPSQVQESFQGLSPEQISQMTLVFYTGRRGHDLEWEAKEIDQQINFLRRIIEENYGGEAAKNIKVLLEIPSFSQDPFSYMRLKAVDGISLSASALKADFLITKHAVIEAEKTLDEPVEHPVGDGVESSIGKEEPVPVEKALLVDKIQEMEEGAVEEEKEAAPVNNRGEMEKEAERHPETDAQAQPGMEYAQSGEGDEGGGEKKKLQNGGQTNNRSSEQLKVKTVTEGINLVKLTVEECAEKLAESHFHQTYLPSETQFESPELKLKRMKLVFKKKFEQFQNRCVKGWEVLFRTMETNHEPVREEIIGTLNLPIEKIMEFADLGKTSKMFNQEGKKSWFEVIGITKDQMGVLYETARYLFENKKYTDAADAFFTLVSMNANDYRYWFGYGMAKKLEKEDLNSALDSFSIANSLNPAAPEPYIHAAECYVEQGNFTEAKRCLSYGEQLLTDGDECAYLKKWAKRLTRKVGGKNEL